MIPKTVEISKATVSRRLVSRREFRDVRVSRVKYNSRQIQPAFLFGVERVPSVYGWDSWYAKVTNESIYVLRVTMAVDAPKSRQIACQGVARLRARLSFHPTRTPPFARIKNTARRTLSDAPACVTAATCADVCAHVRTIVLHIV